MMKNIRLTLLIVWMCRVGLPASVAQTNPYTLIAQDWCKSGILPAERCENLDYFQDKYSLISALMGAVIEKSYTEYGGKYDVYQPMTYRLAVGYWVKKDSAATLGEGEPPHPDSLLLKKADCLKTVVLLQKHQLLNKIQAKTLNNAIHVGQLLHPSYSLAAAAQLLIEEDLESKTFLTGLEDSLSLIASLSGNTSVGMNQYLAGIPGIFSFAPTTSLVEPDQGAKMLEQILRQYYPQVKPTVRQRLTTKGWMSMCKIPIQRYEIIYSISVGYKKDCDVEFHAVQQDGKPMISAIDLFGNENLANLFLQLEQDAQSKYTAVLLLNKAQIKRNILSDMEIEEPFLPEIQPTNNPFFAVRLTEAQYLQIKNRKIVFNQSSQIPLSAICFHRTESALNSADKNRIWEKLSASNLLEQYNTEMQEYLWANLSAYPIADSLEMLRQLFLANYVDAFSRIGSASQVFNKPIRQLSQVSFLTDLARGEISKTDFGNYETEEIKSSQSFVFHYTCKGKPYSIPFGGTREPYDMVILSALAKTWRENNPDGRAFYFIPNTKGYIMYLTQKEAEKFSDTMNLLLKEM